MKLERAGPSPASVQVSDYVAGDKSFPCRAVPGDGMIPLERIIGWILEAGYTGGFDLELIGPRIDAEGRLEATRRARRQPERDPRFARSLISARPASAPRRRCT